MILVVMSKKLMPSCLVACYPVHFAVSAGLSIKAAVPCFNSSGDYGKYSLQLD